MASTSTSAAVREFSDVVVVSAGQVPGPQAERVADAVSRVRLTMMDFDVHMFTDEETGEDANTGRGQLLYPRYDGSLGLIGPATACAAVPRVD